MAKILGLDLGTNSIGWAVVDNEKKCIEAAGSRIIPMDAGLMGDFEKAIPFRSQQIALDLVERAACTNVSYYVAKDFCGHCTSWASSQSIFLHN